MWRILPARRSSSSHCAASTQPARRSPTSGTAPGRVAPRRGAAASGRRPRCARVSVRQRVEVGHVLRVHLHAVRRVGAAVARSAQLAEERLDAGVDVGAVEAVSRRRRMRACRRARAAVDGAVAAGQLPAAADDPRNAVARRQRDAWHVAPAMRSRRQRHRGDLAVAENARPSARDAEARRRNAGRDRRPRRRWSSSRWRRVALLGRQQRQEGGQGVHRERLVGGEHEVLAAHLEPVARVVRADHGGARWRPPPPAGRRVRIGRRLPPVAPLGSCRPAAAAQRRQRPS